MGRVLLAASEFPYREIVGVEFSPELHVIAEENIRNYRQPRQRCTTIKSVCISAERYMFPAGDLVIMLFNPFGPGVMAPLLLNLKQAIESQSRTVWIIYVKPRCGFLMDSKTYLEKVAESLLSDYWYSIYRTKTLGPARI